MASRTFHANSLSKIKISGIQESYIIM